ncbi:MAG: PTS sugar transporter subunit IIA [Victivallaceae bacterium]|jgi:PTS system nitrogen regulatory IIA component|nr:PTS sugar transporter subunit IIA [Victivallaceae bacterium]NLK82674.1 PTS transporter subunit EIIA [Lentisphaerota bacterium]MDD3117152.1 PTS sugar transporter subunit IIA [Victivallaceae bacterium]MDD3703462.1 PTS sugar transporter subunit IIA [Victivallaceae bacterium]MDD4318185.1 PTS sugar transporter subunit IIA [Victivallaceae bacterium]
MNLATLISVDSIISGVEPADKWELLDMMVDSMSTSSAVRHSGIPQERILDAVVKREHSNNTGVGNGYAFPHARIPGLKGLAVGMAFLQKPLNYESMDQVPVNIVCMILAPDKNPTMALKVMAQVVRLFSDQRLKENILKVRDNRTIFNILLEAGASSDIPIMARDIMNSPLLDVRRDTPIYEVIQLMASKHLSALPVVDEHGNIEGHITGARLFQLGMPEFMTRLKGVSFICEFEPFEKYFYEKSNSLAGEVMTSDFCAMSTVATLLEIVYALTTRNYPMIYVLEGNTLVGMIDQGTVLEQIINF